MIKSLDFERRVSGVGCVLEVFCAVFLYEKDAEEARKMPVMVGALRADGMAEVRGALRPGDPVVASGVGKLKDGQKIKPLAAASNLNYGNLL